MSVPHLATWPLLLDTAGYQLDRKGKQLDINGYKLQRQSKKNTTAFDIIS